MTIGLRRLTVLTAFVLLVAGLTGPAYGFFPRGGFNFSQQLRYATWSFKEFDTNENGVIEPGEGLEFRIEGGPRGFTNAEIEQVRAGFQTWQDVPTSYASFRFVGTIEDPIIPASTEGHAYLPTVYMQVTEVAEDDGFAQPDPPEVQVGELTGPIPAVTLTLYTIEMVPIPVANHQVLVPAGTILDCDIVVNASLHRPGLLAGDTTFGTLDLQATITQQVGYLLGLSATPLNNLDPNREAEELGVERAAVQITGADGIPRMVGATPVMFPEYFLTEMPDGELVAGWRDLAPDDISGVSWLYPREDGLENFFSIQHEARTTVRRVTGIPPAPISGAHIVAWADVDGGGGVGRRVPLFSTMTGLYQMYPSIQLSGRFNLMGLWKQMEMPGSPGTLFEPSYVLTMSPIDGLGYDRQAPPPWTAENFDSIQGDTALGTQVLGSLISRPAGYFTTNYSSEVFNEDGNFYTMSNYAAGTPLVWSFERNTVISANSGNTLPTMLPRNVPMFGSPDSVCPMNLIENFGGGGGGDLGGIIGFNTKLRDFRDNTLLHSAVGTALVDLYYRAAPYITYQLQQHESALRLAHGSLLLLLWMWERATLLLVAALLTLAGAYVTAKRRRLRPAGVATIVMVAVLLGVAAAANAGQIPMTTEQLVAESHYIVSGKVVSAEGFRTREGRIYTDVVFHVTDVAKGDLNRGSNLAFTVIGGVHGGLALAATGIPRFVEGEHAVLHLVEIPNYGLIPYGGMGSKIQVYVDPETQEEEVNVGGSGDDEMLPAQDDAADADDNDSGDEEDGDDTGEEKTTVRAAGAVREAPRGRVPVREYMRYLRAIANSQQ